jgi:hypothetical protein
LLQKAFNGLFQFIAAEEKYYIGATLSRVSVFIKNKGGFAPQLCINEYGSFFWHVQSPVTKT